MKILIIEDEYHAAERLQKILKRQDQFDIEVLSVLDSVEDTVEWLRNNETPDLIFMDIQLADGISFSIFEQIKVESPVIFTTAFDQYSLKAFKVNSVDYLLKPIDEEELYAALEKYHQLYENKESVDFSAITNIIGNMNLGKNYRERFLIKQRDKFTFLQSEDVAFFYSEDSVTFVISNDGKSHILEGSLNKLADELNPEKFFRINRSQIIHVNSIQKIDKYFNNRLVLQLKMNMKKEFVVSRDSVKMFKQWLGG